MRLPWVVFAIVLGTAVPASADHLAWNDSEWGRVRTGELVAIGVLTAAAVGSELVISTDRARWRGGILADEEVRAGLYLESPSGIRAAATTSDLLASALVGWPVIGDALLRVWAGDGNRDLALQLIGVDLLSFASTAFLLSLSKQLVARERPWAAYHCQDEPIPDSRCDTGDRFRSFFSGHAAQAFTAASLICIHHRNIPLYEGVFDGVACGIAAAGATTVAVLRILADRHWLSDVVIGAMIGVASGLLIPAALHFGFDWNRNDGRPP